MKTCYFILIFFTTLLCSCDNPQSDLRFINEDYINEKIDSNEMKQALNYRDTLLNRFNVTKIEGCKNTCYHLMIYSSMGYGQSIKFEKEDSSYYLTGVCFSKAANFEDCKNIKTKITFEEWIVFENMIYEYNFWTENQLESNKGVLDGYALFLEGVRPEAKKYGKKTYQFIGRSSPIYDKIADLCSNIISYKENLVNRYTITN